MKMTFKNCMVAAMALLALSACKTVDEPKPYGPLPSEAQLKWQEMEMYAFVHFSMNTFTDMEWGYGDKDPKLFNPTALDCRQWAKACKDAGLKGMILTTKHHDGFCLWPSKYTEYSVKASNWRDGKGDLVKELSDACKEYGLKFGVYLSPWDRNSAVYSTPEYITYYRNQLRELMTNYGDIFEIWFDGANGGTGYYGGADERRSIDNKTYYDWPTTNKMLYEMHPDIIIFSDGGPGCRWCGNEEGWVGETNWSLLRDSVMPGYPNYLELRNGHEDGTRWVPAEVDVSLRPGWFYHESEDHKVKTLPQMMDIYYSSVGRNANLILNIPVDKRGLIHDPDLALLHNMGEKIREDLATNLAAGAKVTASNVRGDARKFAAKKTTDGNKETYWATDDDVKEATLTIDLGKETEFNRFLIQEYIRLGQRVNKFTLEALVDGNWKKIDEQTTIGYKRILRFPTVKASEVRVTIQAKACPLISNIELFNAPKLLMQPTITRDKSGLVTLTSVETDGVDILYSLDGSEPNQLYTVPVPTSGKVTVKALVKDRESGKSSEVQTTSFDVVKMLWTITNSKDAQAYQIFDGQPTTAWTNEVKAMPADLTVDMGEEMNLCGFQYTPDQSRYSKGIISHYAFSVSPDGRQWKQVSSGEFSNIQNNPILQSITFEPVKARFWKLSALSNTADEKCAGYAEVDVMTK